MARLAPGGALGARRQGQQGPASLRSLVLSPHFRRVPWAREPPTQLTSVGPRHFQSQSSPPATLRQEEAQEGEVVLGPQSVRGWAGGDQTLGPLAHPALLYILSLVKVSGTGPYPSPGSMSFLWACPHTALLARSPNSSSRSGGCRRAACPEEGDSSILPAPPPPDSLHQWVPALPGLLPVLSSTGSSRCSHAF